MTRTALSAAILAVTLPGAALALPQVGDVLGTNADAVRSALEAAGCPVAAFEVEDGKVEAKCIETASKARWEIYIDPKTGVVDRMKRDD